MDLWDWAVVRASGKDGKSEVVRLIGRLVKRSAKLHPSMPAGGGFLKTAPICQVRFDLVRVRTGLVLPHDCDSLYSCAFHAGLAHFSL